MRKKGCVRHSADVMRVIRFTNEELFNGIELVLTQIKNALSENAPL